MSPGPPRPDRPGTRGGWSFLAGGGVMGGLIADLDWSCTPLGPIGDWPAHLRTAVGIMLESRHPMLIWWGTDFTMLYNDAFMELAGTKHPGGLGSSGREMFADIWDTIGPMLRGVLRTGRATWVDDQLLLMNRRGLDEETYWTYSYSPVRDADGHVDGVFTATTDTTARVLGERQLRTLRALGGISAVTAPTVELAALAAAAVLEGNRADVPFASIYLVTDDGRTARRAAFQGMRDDTTIVPVELDRHRDADQPVWAVLDSTRPLVLNGLADTYPGLFLPTDGPAGRSDPDTAVAMPLAPAGGGDPVGVLFAGVSPVRSLDGEYRRYLDLVAGQVATALADAAALQSQQRRAEELAELDRAKTEFFTSVSHELRTPLTLITGPAEDGLADVGQPLPPDQRTRMELIARNGGRLRRMVDTLLEFARLEDGALVAHRVPVDLAAFTRGVAESFAPALSRAGLEFGIDCPDLDTAVSVDVEMWEKIVLNLLSNAVKFTLDGRVDLTLTRTGPDVRLQVTDTGIGIPDTEQPRLFQRFHRVRGATGRSHEGSGIGLALVAELAALHGGSVAVRSAAGQGSTFVVDLPAAAQPGTPVAGTGPSSAVPVYRDEALQWGLPGPDPGRVTGRTDDAVDLGGTAGATVLVAEDNPDLRRFLAELLEPHYAVLLATDGAAALRLARTARPDLVLTDALMPELDGFGLLAALRADPATATTPVILLSARAGAESVGAGLAAGADDYLVKPFSTHDLLARVRSNLAMARLRNHEGAWRSALVNALQDALVVVDAAGRVVDINDAFPEVLGYGAEGLPYSPPYPWWPDPDTEPDELAQVVEALTEARVSGGTFLLPQRHRDGRRLWVEASASVVDDPHGTGSMIVAVFHDVTTAHRAAERDGLLAETGRLLTRPGALTDRLESVTAAAAHVLADMAVVSLAAPDGRFVPVAATHRRDPAVAAAVLDLAPHAVPDALRATYRAGHAFVVPEVADHLLVDASADEADLAARRRVLAASVLVAPLVVSGRLLGSLSFVSTTGPRTHDPADLALAEELGRRVAGVVEADRVATQERQLHAASTALAAAATLDEAAAALTEAIREPTGAAGIAVYVTRPDDPAHLHLVRTTGPVDTSATVTIGGTLPIADAARTGTAVWLPDRATSRARYPAGPTGARAVAALPLLVGERVLGVLALTFATDRTFPDAERGFALALVAQAAQAFDRAALTDARWRIAQTLQRSLLPLALPEVARLAIAVHYEPAGQHTQAGGDWYDVIALDDDRVAIIVGDVVGNGPAAAAVMGQLRGALGFLLRIGHLPATALSWLSRYARDVPGALGSTAICMVLHTGTGELCWAAAGHPPPLMRPAGGSARYLEDGHGSVLGVHDGPSYSEGTTALTSGSSVLLYTDGLVERRGEVIDDGLDRLLATTAAHPDAAPAALIHAVLDAALDSSGPADDVALVVVRFLPPPLHLTVPARPGQLSSARREITRWAADNALGAEQTEDLHLALGEALANSVEHAYPTGGPGEIAWSVERTDDGAVRVEVGDDGGWRPPPADRGFRGRGLAMIRALGRDVELDTRSPGTRIRFTLPAPAAGPRLRPEPRAIRARGAARVAGLRVRPDPAGGLRITLCGELDLTTIDGIRTELLHHLATSTGPVVLDTREVTYLASAAVGMLAAAATLAPDRLQVQIRPGSPTSRILDLTGLSRLLSAPGAGTSPVPDHDGRPAAKET